MLNRNQTCCSLAALQVKESLLALDRGLKSESVEDKTTLFYAMARYHMFEAIEHIENIPDESKRLYYQGLWVQAFERLNITTINDIANHIN